jgi:hypothetical protein
MYYLYLLFFILSDLNSGQIISFKPDKLFNLILFDKIKKDIFQIFYIKYK